MKNLILCFMFFLVLSCKAQDSILVHPIDPIKVSLKKTLDNDRILFCDELESKGIAQLLITINKNLKVENIKLSSIRIRVGNNKSFKVYEGKSKEKIKNYFESESFIEKLKVSLKNEEFKGYPYHSSAYIPIKLKNCK